MNKQLYTILFHYLKKAGVFFSKSRLKQLIISHPDRDSLYAMVDTLDELNLENVALRVDMKGLQANGFPVIVYTEEEKERKFIVVEDIVENGVHYYDAENGCSVESLDAFAEKWTGVALYAAQDEIQAELELKKTATKKQLLQWRTILSVVVGVVCIAIWCTSVAWTYTLACILSFASIFTFIFFSPS